MTQPAQSELPRPSIPPQHHLLWTGGCNTSPGSFYHRPQAKEFSSVRSVLSDAATPWTTALQPPCPSPTPGAYSSSCPSRRWCHPTISFSIVPFSSRLQSFPAIRVFSNESVLRIRWPKSNRTAAKLAVYSNSFPDLPSTLFWIFSNQPCFEAAFDVLRHKTQEWIRTQGWNPKLLSPNPGSTAGQPWDLKQVHIGWLCDLDNSHGMFSTVSRKQSLQKA